MSYVAFAEDGVEHGKARVECTDASQHSAIVNRPAVQSLRLDLHEQIPLAIALVEDNGRFMPQHSWQRTRSTHPSQVENALPGREEVAVAVLLSR